MVRRLYQGRAEPVVFNANGKIPETVTESRWHQPWSEPSVKSKAGLPAAEQQFLAFVKASPFPETVSEDRWHQPWSDPVRTRALPTSEQQALAFTATVATTAIDGAVSVLSAGLPGSIYSFQYQALAFTAFVATTPPVDGWGSQLSIPQRQLLGLRPAQQQFLAFDPAVFVASIDGWLEPLSEPPKPKTSLAAAAQQFLAFDPAVFVPFPSSWWTPFVEVPKVKPAVAWQQYLAFDPAVFVSSVDAWGMPLTEPVRTRPSLASAAQQALAYTTFVTTTPTVDGWGAQLSIPQRQLIGLAARQQQFLALAEAAPFPETVSEDRWHQPWGEPSVKTKSGLLAAEQQFLATGYFTPAAVVAPLGGWAQWTDPIQLSAKWTTGDTSYGFAAQTVQVSEDRFHQPWSEPPKPKPALPAFEQQSLAYVPVITTTPSIDGWGSPFAEVPKPKAGTTAACQQFFAFDPAVFVSAPDAWAQAWSEPPKPKTSVNVAAQQALAFDPAVFVPSIDAWQNALSEPVRVQSRITSDAFFYPPNFAAAVAPSFGYFSPFSEPQRQLAGLAARYQQDAAYGFVPIVPPFIFFFGNEEPLPWPGFRANAFIRENYDQLAFPPFPIPNPPQTQAKFTVSGPSVSDLFPVSGVVYPYAPETRKTVP